MKAYPILDKSKFSNNKTIKFSNKIETAIAYRSLSNQAQDINNKYDRNIISIGMSPMQHEVYVAWHKDLLYDIDEEVTVYYPTFGLIVMDNPEANQKVINLKEDI